jgi:hypothetical protein
MADKEATQEAAITGEKAEIWRAERWSSHS